MGLFPKYIGWIRLVYLWLSMVQEGFRYSRRSPAKVITQKLSIAVQRPRQAINGTLIKRYLWCLIGIFVTLCGTERLSLQQEILCQSNNSVSIHCCMKGWGGHQWALYHKILTISDPYFCNSPWCRIAFHDSRRFSLYSKYNNDLSCHTDLVRPSIGPL